MTTNPSSNVVGRVVGLWRYPVKSMAAEPVKRIGCSWHGFAGDRRYAFLRNDSARNGFPWFTLRQNQTMNQFVPSFVDPSQPEKSKIRVRAPSGDDFAIDDPRLGLALCEDGAQVIKQDRGVFDTFPVSLISTQTIEALSESVDLPLDPLRFRPNIVVECEDPAPFQEDQWVGKTLAIGGMRLRLDQRDGRCVVITMDPETGERTPDILRSVRALRQGCLGVYGSTEAPGEVAVGDSVTLD